MQRSTTQLITDVAGTRSISKRGTFLHRTGTSRLTEPNNPPPCFFHGIEGDDGVYQAAILIGKSIFFSCAALICKQICKQAFDDHYPQKKQKISPSLVDYAIIT